MSTYWIVLTGELKW